ncbi:MAG: hypothetical protein F6K65_38590 [Moorea sp. SIO3C2]|nr:hypothetical protein [Moorena sp. SIO3C2]
MTKTGKLSSLPLRYKQLLHNWLTPKRYHDFANFLLNYQLMGYAHATRTVPRSAVPCSRQLPRSLLTTDG